MRSFSTRFIPDAYRCLKLTAYTAGSSRVHLPFLWTTCDRWLFIYAGIKIAAQWRVPGVGQIGLWTAPCGSSGPVCGRGPRFGKSSSCCAIFSISVSYQHPPGPSPPGSAREASGRLLTLLSTIAVTSVRLCVQPARRLRRWTRFLAVWREIPMQISCALSYRRFWF